MFKQLIVCLVMVMMVLMANTASATLTYSWNFDDNTNMGWTCGGAKTSGSYTAVTDVHWYGFKDPPTNHVSNNGLGLNNNGVGGNNTLYWIIYKAITPGVTYQLSFDYSEVGDGTYAQMMFYDSAGHALPDSSHYVQGISDTTVWGWCPSLTVNSTSGSIGWTHKVVTVNSTYLQAATIGIQFAMVGQWGQTIIDNIQLTPEPATMSIFGLGALALLRRKS